MTDHHNHPIKGIVFALGAYLCFACMSLFSKSLVQDYTAFEAVFYRNLFGLIICTAMWLCMRNRLSLRVQNPKLVAFRSVIGVCGIILTVSALKDLSISMVTTLLFASAFFAPLLSLLILKEPVTKAQWSAIALGFIGVLIIAQPSDTVAILGVIMGIAAAFSNASEGVCLRALKAESAFAIVFHFFLIGSLVLLPYMAIEGSLLSTQGLLYALGYAVSGVIGQQCIAKAFSHAPAAYVMPISYTGLVWAMAFDAVLFNAFPDLNLWIGAAVIISASLMVAYIGRSDRKKKLQPIAVAARKE